MREHFQSQLRDLQRRTILLGAAVSANLLRTGDVFVTLSRVQATDLIAGDHEINQKSLDIKLDALRLIAQQAPMATDLRLIAAMIEIAGELERINDYIKGIARISLGLSEPPSPPRLDQLRRMVAVSNSMIAQAMDAVEAQDHEAASRIPTQDEQMDELYESIYRELLQDIISDPSTLRYNNLLQWAAHNLERVADRATNICEWIVFIVTGEYREFDSELEAPPAPNSTE